MDGRVMLRLDDSPGREAWGHGDLPWRPVSTGARCPGGGGPGAETCTCDAPNACQGLGQPESSGPRPALRGRGSSPAITGSQAGTGQADFALWKMGVWGLGGLVWEREGRCPAPPTLDH